MASNNNADLIAKGQECIEAAQSAFNFITTQSDAEVADKHLSTLQDSGRFLQEFAEESKDKLLIKEEQLNNELVTLESQKFSYESTISRLNYEKNRAQERLSSQRRKLTEAENELYRAKESLSNAEFELKQARIEETQTMMKTAIVGGVLGLVTFGVGAVGVSSAVGGLIGAKIAELEGKVKQAESNIQYRKLDIERTHNEIRSISSSLKSIECEISNHRSWISNNERQKRDIHDKITSVVNSIAFQKEAANFWKMFTEAAERATERTERLQKIVDKAAKKENFRILRSDGTITIAETFVEAWKEVTIKECQIMFTEN